MTIVFDPNGRNRRCDQMSGHCATTGWTRAASPAQSGLFLELQAVPEYLAARTPDLTFGRIASTIAVSSLPRSLDLAIRQRDSAQLHLTRLTRG